MLAAFPSQCLDNSWEYKYRACISTIVWSCKVVSCSVYQDGSQYHFAGPASAAVEEAEDGEVGADGGGGGDDEVLPVQTLVTAPAVRVHLAPAAPLRLRTQHPHFHLHTSSGWSNVHRTYRLFRAMEEGTWSFDSRRKKRPERQIPDFDKVLIPEGVFILQGDVHLDYYVVESLRNLP